MPQSRFFLRLASTNQPIDLILFDVVGTVLVPDPPVWWVYREAAARQGVDLDPQTIKTRFQTAFAQDEARDRQLGSHHGWTTNETRERERWRRIVKETLGPLPDPDRAFEELWDEFARSDRWRCPEDARDALARLNQLGLAWGIASNFDGRLRRVLRGHPEFDALGLNKESPNPPGPPRLTISSEVGARKPDRRFFDRIRETAALLPERILFVGDDPLNDGEAARALGFRTVQIDRHAERDHLDDPIAPRVRDLRHLVDQLVPA